MELPVPLISVIGQETRLEPPLGGLNKKLANGSPLASFREVSEVTRTIS